MNYIVCDGELPLTQVYLCAEEGKLTVCPVCGKEFYCFRTHHRYKRRQKQKIVYYCSYKCYKKRRGNEG